MNPFFFYWGCRVLFEQDRRRTNYEQNDRQQLNMVRYEKSLSMHVFRCRLDVLINLEESKHVQIKMAKTETQIRLWLSSHFEFLKLFLINVSALDYLSISLWAVEKQWRIFTQNWPKEWILDKDSFFLIVNCGLQTMEKQLFFLSEKKRKKVLSFFWFR